MPFALFAQEMMAPVTTWSGLCLLFVVLLWLLSGVDGDFANPHRLRIVLLLLFQCTALCQGIDSINW